MKTKLVFLGFVISKEGLKMDLEKIKDIMEWSSPRNVNEVSIFHGLSIFYKKFITDFSNICALIVENIKQGHRPFVWIGEVEKGFKLLKKKITERPILALPYFQNLFEVKCDASGMAIGVVLIQEEKHVPYFNENLNDAKQKYSSYDKEFYAVIQEFKKLFDAKRICFIYP